MIKCDTCPRCKDVYPGKVDDDGYHYCICGMSGNIVYKIPRKMKRYSGNGYIYCGVTSCGLYDTVEDALADKLKADGCTGCKHVDKPEWKLPCAQCKRSCKDYWETEK